MYDMYMEKYEIVVERCEILVGRVYKIYAERGYDVVVVKRCEILGI